MPSKMNRRDFVRAGAVAAVASGVPRAVFGQAPTMMTGSSVKPVVVSSSNGNRFKNGGPVTCVELAFSKIVKGEDVLDSLIAGVNLVELDPEESGVGFGGIPNAEGVVQLDSSCMHGPKKRAGAVGGIEGVKTPSLVARAVMESTDHHLLVGEGAQAFARNMGFEILPDLNTERSRRAWLEWKRRVDSEHYLDPKKRQEAGLQAALQMAREGIIDPEHVWGTINCDGLSPKGEICGVTTTSGLAFKIPGRLGDSPILGAGLYVDGDVGAAGSTGRGEANLYSCASFLIVEGMRKGMHPKDAGLEALKRIKANTIEKRLLNGRGLPAFQLNFYILNARGEYAGVSMYQSTYAVCTEAGPKTLDTVPLLEGRANA